MLVPIAAALAAITLAVDARDVREQVWHATESIALDGRPGVVTMLYPKWIPGAESPVGPVAGLASLRASANGAPLRWHRDLDDVYAFDIDVPAGANRLDLAYDFFEGETPSNASQHLAVLDWNDVVLYPKGARAHDTPVDASIVLPGGWRSATALDPRGGLATASSRRFARTTLETLVDSPLYAGRYATAWPLYREPGGAEAEFDAFAETPAALAAPPSFQQQTRRLVREELATFGARHWTHYRFLLELSDDVQGRGLEHHASSENGTGERGLVDDQLRGSGTGGLISHEFTHSWNGKYRRPAGLATPDFETPMNDELLWVYEGMTQYYGVVFQARAGFVDPAAFRETLAGYYARLDAEPGRRTKPLADTVANDALGRGSQLREFSAETRGGDFYGESALMYLEADTLIRERTNGRRSWDDVARRFAGPPSGAPRVMPYTRADLIAAANAVLPYDWAGFFRDRVDRVALHPPSGGFTHGGWRLVYTPQRTPAQIRRERASRGIDTMYSLGADIAADGTLTQVLDGSPLFRAGLGAGMKLLAVDDHAFTPDRLRDALAQAHREPHRLRMTYDDLGAVRTAYVAYSGGERYPRLVRVAGTVDRLDAIAAPRTALHPPAVTW